LFSDDLADMCLFLMDNYRKTSTTMIVPVIMMVH
jgi:hypothetical protein